MIKASMGASAESNCWDQQKHSKNCWAASCLWEGILYTPRLSSNAIKRLLFDIKGILSLGTAGAFLSRALVVGVKLEPQVAEFRKCNSSPPQLHCDSRNWFDVRTSAGSPETVFEEHSEWRSYLRTEGSASFFKAAASLEKHAFKVNSTAL